jgi:hypothetical protein
VKFVSRALAHRRPRIALVALALFGATTALAATLAGLTSKNFGGNDIAVTSCDTDGVGVNYTTGYSATSGVYEVTLVNITGVNSACNLKTISVTVRGAAGVSVGSGSATADSSGAKSVTTSSGASAASVTGIAVVITG